MWNICVTFCLIRHVERTRISVAVSIQRPLLTGNPAHTLRISEDCELDLWVVRRGAVQQRRRVAFEHSVEERDGVVRDSRFSLIPQ